jgi:THO complex subunit 4
VEKLEMMYDRAGRSEGTCFVTFAHESDAMAAIHDYDGATAKGQLITVTFVGPPPARSLFDRIKSSPADERRDPTRKPTPPGIDRYVPPDRRRERERTQGGPRPAAPPQQRGRRGGRGRTGRGESGSGNVRPRKTVEELDAEMNDYFGAAQEENATPAAPAEAVVEEKVDDDGDLIL